MVSCPTCHISPPLATGFARRSVGEVFYDSNDGNYSPPAVQVWFGYSSAATSKYIRNKILYRDEDTALGDSNIDRESVV